MRGRIGLLVVHVREELTRPGVLGAVEGETAFGDLHPLVEALRAFKVAPEQELREPVAGRRALRMASHPITQQHLRLIQLGAIDQPLGLFIYGLLFGRGRIDGGGRPWPLAPGVEPPGLGCPLLQRRENHLPLRRPEQARHLRRPTFRQAHPGVEPVRIQEALAALLLGVELRVRETEPKVGVREVVRLRRGIEPFHHVVESRHGIRPMPVLDLGDSLRQTGVGVRRPGHRRWENHLPPRCPVRARHLRRPAFRQAHPGVEAVRIPETLLGTYPGVELRVRDTEPQVGLRAVLRLRRGIEPFHHVVESGHGIRPMPVLDLDDSPRQVSIRGRLSARQGSERQEQGHHRRQTVQHLVSPAGHQRRTHHVATELGDHTRRWSPSPEPPFPAGPPGFRRDHQEGVGRSSLSRRPRLISMVRWGKVISSASS